MEAYTVLMEHYAASPSHFELLPGLSPDLGHDTLRTEHVYCGASFGRSLTMAMMAIADGDLDRAERKAREGLLQLWRDAVMSSPASPRRQASIHYHATQEAVMRELRAPHQRPDGTCVVLITERQRDADPRVIEARLAYDEADALLMGPVCELARQHDGGGAPQAAW